MTSELNLRPDRLRAHAVTAIGLADELRAAGGGWALADRAADLRAALLRSAVELAELSHALSAAASSAEQRDGSAARAFDRLRRSP